MSKDFSRCVDLIPGVNIQHLCFHVASQNAMPTDVIDKNSIERALEELQEIEDGLVKLMAYRVCLLWWLLCFT